MTQNPAKLSKRAAPAKAAKHGPADKPAESPARAAAVTPAARERELARVVEDVHC